MHDLFFRMDHLVYATTDLASTVRDLGALLGVGAAPGGRHPAWGTKNALVSLGPRLYLEIVGPDPEASPPAGPRPFSIDSLSVPRLVTWACRAEDLVAAVQAARRCGVELGEIQGRSRQRPDGSTLSWTMTDPLAKREGGVVPFLIDWGDSPHPAAGAPTGCALLRMRATHPDPKRISSIFQALGLDLSAEPGASPALEVSLRTPRGVVVLR